MPEAITLSTAIQDWWRMPSHKLERLSLHVVVISPGSLGGTPCVPIINMHAGFDWDNGKVLLQPETPLTRLTTEDVAAIHESAKKGQSWHAFKSYEKQANQIKNLQAALDEWTNKTEWVRKTASPKELDLHCADVMRDRINALESELAALKGGL